MTKNLVDKNYSISELAAEFSITTRTIRFYEEKGLLQPARQGQKRIFENADRIKLKLIVLGKKLGFSLDESASIIQLYKPQEDNRDQLVLLNKIISDKRVQLHQQMEDIHTMLEELDAHEIRCNQTLEQIPPS